MGSNSIDIDKIVDSEGRRATADYAEGMLALGWRPYLVIEASGAISLIEIQPDGVAQAQIEKAREISAWWRATEDRRTMIEKSLRRRGLVYYR